MVNEMKLAAKRANLSRKKTYFNVSAKCSHHRRVCVNDKMQKITKHCKETELSLLDAMMQPEAPITHTSKYLTGSDRLDWTLRINFCKVRLNIQFVIST